MQETISHLGCTIEITPDEDALNPRSDCDNFGTMVCWHRRYHLGERHGYSDPLAFMRGVVAAASPFNTENMAGPKLTALFDRYFLWLPLYIYDHSGITMATTPFSCPWDSGRVGYIYVAKRAACANWRKRSLKALTTWRKADGAFHTVESGALAILQSEVKTYDSYIRGEVHSYRAVAPDGEEIAAVGGFIGDTTEMVDQAKAEIASYVQRNAQLQPV